MSWMEVFRCLELQNHLAIHNDVCRVQVYYPILVFDLETRLTSNRKASKLKFRQYGEFVCLLAEPRAKRVVYLKQGATDLIGQFCVDEWHGRLSSPTIRVIRSFRAIRVQNPLCVENCYLKPL